MRNPATLDVWFVKSLYEESPRDVKAGGISSSLCLVWCVFSKKKAGGGLFRDVGRSLEAIVLFYVCYQDSVCLVDKHVFHHKIKEKTLFYTLFRLDVRLLTS